MTLTYNPLPAPVRGRVGRKFTPVPFEVWDSIAKFVPSAELRELYAVNSAFLDAAFNIRYARVELNDDFGRLRRILSRLRDPFIAPRIRSLCIKPWKVADDPSERFSLRSRLKVGLKSLVDPDFPEFHEKEQLQQRVMKDIKTVMEAISSFTIVEYTVDWDEQPYHPLFFSSFLSPFLRLSPSLRSLNLKIPTDQYIALFPTRRSPGLLPLRRLEELNITLSTGFTSKKDIDDHLDCLAVFIHNAFPTLTSLSITTTKTSENLDLSHFFDILGGTSRLKSFSLSIPPQCNHLSEPKKLRQVLANHRDTLQSLTLVMPFDEPGQRAPPISWIVESIKDLAFPELETLHLTLSGNSHSLGPVLNCLSTCATTLTTLLLEGRALPDNDVISLFSYIPVSSGIRRLKVTVKTLSVQLTDLLFTQLTELEDAEVVFKRLAGQRNSAFNDFRALLFNTEYQYSQVHRLRLETLPTLASTSLPQRAKNLLHPAFEHCLPQLKDFLSDSLPQ